MLAVVSLGVPLALSLKQRVNAEVRSQALSQADIVAATSADLLGPADRARLRALARTSATLVRGRVIIVDRAGRVLSDSASTATVGASYQSRPEVASALSGHTVQTQRASHTLAQPILATAVPVIRGGRTVGAVRITESVTAVQRAVHNTILALVLVAGTVLLLGLLAGGFIARQVALPLRRLEGAARRLADGDLTARATVEGSAEQRSLSDSFNEMAGRVQRLLLSQRRFIADASHELRTPLTALRLRLEETSMTSSEPATKEALADAMCEVDRLAVIIDELLLLSREEDRQLAPETVDLADAVRRASQRWEPAARAAGVKLGMAIADPGAVRCAAGDVDRVLDVLIENALRYGGAGAELTLAAGPARVEVCDRGPGLAAGEEDLVFERFHRGAAASRGDSGSGLGLSIARTLALAWNGDVRIGNRPGGGAVAVLELPSAT